MDVGGKRTELAGATREIQLVYVITGLIIVLIAFALRTRSGGFAGSKSAEKELYRLCRGDKSQMERLIALEQTRSHNSSRQRAAKDAVESFKRDN